MEFLARRLIFNFTCVLRALYVFFFGTQGGWNMMFEARNTKILLLNNLKAFSALFFSRRVFFFFTQQHHLIRCGALEQNCFDLTREKFIQTRRAYRHWRSLQSRVWVMNRYYNEQRREKTARNSEHTWEFRPTRRAGVYDVQLKITSNSHSMPKHSQRETFFSFFSFHVSRTHIEFFEHDLIRRLEASLSLSCGVIDGS